MIIMELPVEKIDVALLTVIALALLAIQFLLA